jgi:hypothetical protein
MAKKKKRVEFPSIDDLPRSSPRLGPTNPLDSKFYLRGSVRNPHLFGTARYATAIVGTSKGTGIDFTDIQEAVDHVEDLNGGIVYLRPGSYVLDKQIILPSKISLIGSGPGSTTIDASKVEVSSIKSGATSGAIEARGTLVTNTGTVAASSTSTITGTGTNFSSAGVIKGDTFYTFQAAYLVDSVASDTSLNIDQTYFAVALSGDNFNIIRPVDTVTISDLSILGPKETGAANDIDSAIYIGYCKNFNMNNVEINCQFRAGYGIILNDTYNYNFTNCSARNTTSSGIVIDRTSLGGGTNVSLGTLINCSFYANFVYGAEIWGQHSRVIGGNYSHNENDGIRAEGDDIYIIGAKLTKNGVGAISTDANADGTTIIGNYTAGNVSGVITDAGTNTVRATRFVPVEPRVQVLNTDPANTNWTDEDVTAETSANTFMVCGTALLRESAGATRNLYIRKNGSSTGQVGATNILRTQSGAGIKSSFQCEVDTGQIFEWSVDNADVDLVTFEITGYWEYID